MNTFGTTLTLTTFGESHGPAMGGVIDGFPAGFKVDFDKLYEEVAKRRPGASALVTARKEDDRPEFLSGISPEGITLGTPIGFIVRNKDQHSADYDTIADVLRPAHADYTYMQRYGIRDPRGGGRASARETVNWVVAGALALQWLETREITIDAVLSQVGPVTAGDIFDGLITQPDKPFSLSVNPDIMLAMEQQVIETKKRGDSVGGRVSCLITGMPPGIGNPVADKLQAALARAMMSINAAKGFEYGIGFRAASACGSDINDSFIPNAADPAHPLTSTNYSGGIQGGISNGMPIFFSVAFKPTPTIMRPQTTTDVSGSPTTLCAAGRHDPCVAVRAVPVVKAMAALVIADFMAGAPQKF